MKISASSSMGGPKPIKKSFAAKRVDKKNEGLPESNRERYYKIKAKATDPSARAGVANQVKTKEISKNQADRLENRAKNISKHAENTGRMDANVAKKAGVTTTTRYKASPVANQKSNLKVGAKLKNAITGKNASTSQEKATYGKYKYVGTKKRDDSSSMKTIPSKSFVPKTATSVKKPLVKVDPNKTGDDNISTRTEDKTTVKKMTLTPSSTKKKSTTIKTYPAKNKSTTGSKKYYLKDAAGVEEEVSEETRKKFPHRFK